MNLPLNKITYIELSTAYRRKANAIHKRFVDNVQDGEDDCKDYYVSKEKLYKLVETCREVLKSIESQKLVETEIDDKYHP
jgi:hypothetical protein